MLVFTGRRQSLTSHLRLVHRGMGILADNLGILLSEREPQPITGHGNADHWTTALEDYTQQTGGGKLFFISKICYLKGQSNEILDPHSFS